MPSKCKRDALDPPIGPCRHVHETMAPMRAKVLVVLCVFVFVVAGTAVVRTMLTTGQRAAPSGTLTVSAGSLANGQVTSTVAPIEALGETRWPVLVAAQPNGTFNAFLGRSPHLGCRINWVGDRTVAHFASDVPQVAFEDPCGGAVFALDGTCLGGPCNRGLDRFEIRMIGERATVDLRQLTPGEPRSTTP